MHRVYKQLLSLLFTITLLGTQTSIVSTAQANCTADAFVQPGDTLSIIASRYLGDRDSYLDIVEATNVQAATDSSYATISNPNIILVGWKLCISTSSSAASTSVPSAAAPTPSMTATSPQRTTNSNLTATSTASPTATSTVRPASTSTPTSTPTSTSSSSNTSDEPDITQMRSLSIETMRQRGYPGSNLAFRQTLNAGINYSRYLVSYQSDGLKIYALLTIPNGVQPANGWPVIIFNHGYIPPEQYRTTERYIAYVDGFARNGYIVLRPDYRGHGSSEGEARSAYRTPDYAVDVLNAVGSMKRYAKADRSRIGMWGHSMGGHITLRAMVVDPEIIAGVIWAGTAVSYDDLLNRWENHQSPWRELAARWREKSYDEFGSPAENPAFWNSISANSFVADLNGPLQLHHGTADYVVPQTFSAILYNEINTAGGEVEYYSYPGDNHNLSVYFTTAMNRSIAFFDEHVKGIDN